MEAARTQSNGLVGLEAPLQLRFLERGPLLSNVLPNGISFTG